MSDYEQKDNSGALFDANSVRCLRQGTAKIDGNEVGLLVTETKTKDGRQIFDTYMKVGPFFVNKYKEEGDTKPDISCKILIDGEEKQMAGWKNVSKRGVSYLSLKFSEPRQQGQVDAPRQPQESTAPDDDIPF